jgi:hypothetical protein
MGNYGICRLFKEFLHNFRVKSEFFFCNFNCLRITGFLNALLYRFNLSLLNVICPSDAVAAVLKGAVMYGHNPELISERKCPRTYGITVNRRQLNFASVFLFVPSSDAVT